MPRGVQVATLAGLAVSAAASSGPQADGYFQEARAMVREMPESGREFALADLAAALAESGRAEEAQEAAAAIPSSWKRAETLVRVAAGLSPSDPAVAEQLFRHAGSLAAGLWDEPDSGFCLGQVAAAFARAGRVVEAHRITDWVPVSCRDEPLHALAGALSQAGRFTEASEVTERIQGAWRNQSARQNLVAALLRAGCFGAAERHIAAMDNPEEALGALAEELAAGGRHPEAYEVSLRIGGGPERVRVLARLAAAVAQADPERAEALFDEALAAASPTGAVPPAELLIGLVAAFGHLGKPQVARRLAQCIPGPLERVEAMGVLAGVLTCLQDREAEQALVQAREMASAFGSGRERSEGEGRLALGLAREGAFAVARQVAEAIEDDAERRTVSVRIAEDEHRRGIWDGTGDVDVDSTRDAGYAWRARKDRTTAGLLESGAVSRFLAELHSCSGAALDPLDRYLGELFRWASHLHEMDPGATSSALREAVRVASWVRSDWRTIHRLLLRV